MNCCRCDDAGVRAVSKGDGYVSHYCAKHYRIGRMRAEAQRDGKTVPTIEQLEALFPKDMSCPVCNVEMQLDDSRGVALIASLQHWRDGSFGVICMRCNGRERNLPNDAGAPLIAAGLRFCVRCEEYKPDDAFPPREDGRRRSYCVACDKAYKADYYQANREKAIQYARDRRAQGKS